MLGVSSWVAAVDVAVAADDPFAGADPAEDALAAPEPAEASGGAGGASPDAPSEGAGDDEAPDEDGAGGLDPTGIAVDVEDASGLRWQIANDGGILGSAGGVEGGSRLMIGTDPFVPESVDVDPFSASVVSHGRAGDVEVVRVVRADPERGGVLFVDTVAAAEDAGGPTNLECVLVSGLSGLLETVAVEGGANARGVDVRQAGLPGDASGLSAVARKPGSIPSFHWVVAGQEVPGGDASAERPEVSLSEGRELLVRFRVKAEPGERVSLVHWAFQRPSGLQGGEDDFGGVFDPFVRRGHLIGFAPPAGAPIGRVVNFLPSELSDEGFVAPEAGALVVVRELEKRLGVRRLDQDILWVSGEAQLSGKAEGSAIRLTGARGAMEIPFASVAAIEGGGGRGRQHRLMLRDGRVFVGRIAMDHLKITGQRGWGLEPAIDQIEWILFRLDPGDGRPPVGVERWVALHSGEVLPLVSGSGELVPLQTAWGPVELPLESISSVRYLKEPSPRYRVDLEDGTRWTGFLGDRELAARLSGGEPFTTDADGIGVPLPSIASLWKAGGAPSGEPTGDLVEVLAFDELDPPLPGDRSFCLLMGGNVLAAELADESLHVVTGTAVTELAPAEILEIARDPADLDELNPLFEIRLRGGDQLRGRLREVFVTLETTRRQWTVPVQHFLGARRPARS